MGETGCGKTRLIKFMCGLQVPPGVEMTNMILMKVCFSFFITHFTQYWKQMKRNFESHRTRQIWKHCRHITAHDA
jgi:energy-coupling factor transporter ATP-binding protein EcfA2